MNNTQKDNTEKGNPKKKITSKQIVAMIGVILLALLYIITLIVAIVDTSASGKMLAMCLFATFAIPILIWIYTWMYGRLTNKHTFADIELHDKKDENEA